MPVRRDSGFRLALRDKLTSPFPGVGFCAKKIVCRETRADIRPRIRKTVIHVHVEHAHVPTVIRVAAAKHEPSAQKMTQNAVFGSYKGSVLAENAAFRRRCSAVFVFVLTKGVPRAVRSIRVAPLVRPFIMPRFALDRPQRDARR